MAKKGENLTTKVTTTLKEDKPKTKDPSVYVGGRGKNRSRKAKIDDLIEKSGIEVKYINEEEKVAEKRKKRPHEYSPIIGNNGMMLQPGENNKFMAINIELLMMEDIDMTDVDEVKKRIAEYFGMYAKYDMKPTVSGLGIALNGHSRQWLHSVTHDAPLGGKGNKCTLPREVTDCIKRAYKMLESSWENYMLGGKINPVTGIFLAKNNFGYQDRVETVINTNNNDENDFNVREIKERYK